MGVRGLTTYVQHDTKSTKPFKLHDTDLVIDGSALQYYLYGISSQASRDAKYNGDYVAYSQTIMKFFHALKKCKIIPYVIIDGGMDPSEIKLKTILERMRHRLSSLKRVASGYEEHLLPILSSRVFIEVLMDMKVKVIRSIFEADGDVAMVGNILECPVLSNDSDFYIFDLKGGYITLDSMHFQQIQTCFNGENSFKCILCDRFVHSYFLNPHPGLKPQVLPLLSCIIGNDYISSETFKNICASGSSEPTCRKERRKRMERLLAWLAGKSLEEGRRNVIQQTSRTGRETATLLLDKALELYSRAIATDPCPLNHLNQNECDSNHVSLMPEESQLSESIIKEHIQAFHDSSLLNLVTTGKIFLDPQSEHFSIASSYSSARKLIIYYCSMLRPTDDSEMEVTVYERIDANIGEDSFRVVTKLSDGTSIPSITSLDDLTVVESRNLVLKLLDSHEDITSNITSKLGELSLDDDSVSLVSSFVIVLNYTIANSEDSVTVESVIALVVCLIYYEIIVTNKRNKMIECVQKLTVKSLFDKLTKKPSKTSILDTRIVHFNSQFQAVILFFSRINRLLKLPIAEIQVHRFLNGVLFYNLVSELRQKDDPFEFVDRLFRVERVKNIFRTIFALVSDKLIRMKESGQKRNTKKVMKKIRKVPVKIVPTNKFSLLNLEDTQCWLNTKN